VPADDRHSPAQRQDQQTVTVEKVHKHVSSPSSVAQQQSTPDYHMGSHEGKVSKLTNMIDKTGIYCTANIKFYQSLSKQKYCDAVTTRKGWSTPPSFARCFPPLAGKHVSELLRLS
jgi:hypothetical protein